MFIWNTSVCVRVSSYSLASPCNSTWNRATLNVIDTSGHGKPCDSAIEHTMCMSWAPYGYMAGGDFTALRRQFSIQQMPNRYCIFDMFVMPVGHTGCPHCIALRSTEDGMACNRIDSHEFRRVGGGGVHWWFRWMSNDYRLRGLIFQNIVLFVLGRIVRDWCWCMKKTLNVARIKFGNVNSPSNHSSSIHYCISLKSISNE